MCCVCVYVCKMQRKLDSLTENMAEPYTDMMAQTYCTASIQAHQLGVCMPYF